MFNTGYGRETGDYKTIIINSNTVFRLNTGFEPVIFIIARFSAAPYTETETNACKLALPYPQQVDRKHLLFLFLS